MKCILLVITLLLIQLKVQAQASDNRLFLETSKKANHYYVDLGEMDALVFEVGMFPHGPEMGCRIKRIDTLVRQSDGAYIGGMTKIMKKKDAFFLIHESNKKKEMSLVNVADSASANTQLNNAYYLDRYLAMSKEVDYAYPLWNASWSRFETWRQLSNKEINYKAFRIFTDERMKFMKDSIVEAQSRYTALMNHLLQNVATINYISLRDSLDKLPVDYSSSYFQKVVHEVAKKQPEFFFQLAEDSVFKRQSYIFDSIGSREKEVLAKLKLVEGHDKIKKAFLKYIKFRRSMPFVVVGLTLVECAAIVCLVVVIF